VTNAGAEDFSEEEESYIIVCEPHDLLHVKEAVEKLGFDAQDAAIEMIPKTYVECDPETIKANLALIEWLENIEDVDTVFHNMKILENE
jgi:transcriptional/translational regulatory protein YebC/TACO1